MKIDSKSETATLAVCGLQPRRFVFILESILALAPCGLGAHTTVLKTVEQNLSLGRTCWAVRLASADGCFRPIAACREGQ